MKKYLGIFLLLVLIWGCSGGKETANMTVEEHYNYALSLFDEEDYEAALKEFESIILQHPGSQYNDDAQYYLALTHYRREEYLLAAYEFSKLIRDIPASDFVPNAQYMLADSYYMLSPNFQLDPSYTKKSIEEFQAFIDYFPLNEKVAEAEAKIKEMNEKLAHKEYHSAYIYERMEYNDAAIIYYDKVAKEYHDTKYAPMAIYNKVRLLIDRDREQEALKDIQLLLARYPDSQYAGEMAKLQDELTKDS